MKITRFQIWLLKMISQTIVKQSEFHTNNIRQYFKAMVEAARHEFTEDSPAMLDLYLKQLFHESLQDR